MRTAHPLGLSPDGRTLIVVIEGGEQVGIPADERLKAALRNDRPRIGQLEIDMDSALRPRDIQARIRAGESLEAVAQAAGVPVAKIEPFAGPVIAEREHIAGLAQTNPVRRAGDAVAHRSLRNVVADRLLSRGVDGDSVEWDAWRTEDRRWTVRLSYESGSVQRQAEFVYDQTGRFSTAANDDARWLTGEQSSSHGPQPGRRRRTGEPDAGAGLDLNDELAIVRAIQPQFAVTPDIEEEDLLDEPEDDEADDGSSDSEDAFAEGDLAEVDGVYDIVPGDRSNMDVLYEMLSSFDEDSVQIYAGLVRPRPEQSAAPVLDEGPVNSEAVTEELDFDGGEPTERLADAEFEESFELAGDEDGDLIGAETAVDGLRPAVDDDLAAAEPEPADAGHDDAESEAAPFEAEPDGHVATETGTVQEGVASFDEQPGGEAPTEDAEPTEPPADAAEAEPEAPSPGADEDAPATEAEPEPAAGAELGQEPSADAEPAAAGADPEGAQAAEDAEERRPRPGRVRPSPAEPEQPSLVDEAGNEPSRPVKRKRASVPSWDEIMFGAPKPKD